MAENFQKIESNLDGISKKFDNISQDLIKLEKNNIQEIQAGVLDSLYQIRKDLLEEIKLYGESRKIGTNDENSGNLDDNNKKIDDFNEENRRLNYRIKHLVRGMQEILENKETDDLKKENEKLKYRIKILLRNFE